MCITTNSKYADEVCRGWRPVVDEELLRKTIKHLRQELREVVHAIWALEAVARGKPVRGRPPGLTGEGQRVEWRGKKPGQKA